MLGRFQNADSHFVSLTLLQSDMFERAIRTFDERRQYATQVARTLYSLALTQEMAGRHEDSARTSEKYSIAMRKLSKEHGCELKYKDLDDLIRNNWD